jgi:serine phosphatase RsbU (regulator of sigma subunit)
VSRQLAQANAHIEAELHRMARIQRALLPEPIPDIPGIRMAASYETFGQVGGDLYDFIPLRKDASQWCIFIGDASGHGPSAAVVAAMTLATLHDCAGYSTVWRQILYAAYPVWGGRIRRSSQLCKMDRRELSQCSRRDQASVFRR